jgi:hypothetical protein
MQSDAISIDCGSDGAAKPKTKRRSQAAKARLTSLADLDRRTAVFRLVTDEIRAIEGDLGGADRLSTAERAIVSDAALAGAMAQDLGARWLRGEPVQVGEYCTLINARRRLLETVGLGRRANDVSPSLSQYLSAKRSAEASDAP